MYIEIIQVPKLVYVCVCNTVKLLVVRTACTAHDRDKISTRSTCCQVWCSYAWVPASGSTNN